MNDRTSRRLLIIFALCILLSLGAIAIGFLGIVDLLDSGIVATVRDWIEPIVSIRSDGPGPNADSTFQEGPSAIELEATHLAEQQVSISEVYAEWSSILEEAFVVNDVVWPEFDEEDDLAKLSVEISNGKYRWEAHANDGFVWWSYPSIDPLTDFYAEIEVIQSEGDPYGEMGLVFRLDEDQFYLYEVSGEYYSLWRSVPDGWSDLIDWTPSDAIRPGGINLLGILAHGEQIYLFINDQLVAEVTDTHYTAGVIGVAVGLEEAGDSGVFEFDNLLITAPLQ
jgi:hypothetical protein